LFFKVKELKSESESARSKGSLKSKLLASALLVTIILSPIFISLSLFFLNDYLLKIVNFKTVILGGSEFPLISDNPFETNNFAFKVDITELKLTNLADDSSNFPSASPLVLYENGVKLTPHIPHDELRKAPICGFSHWGQFLVLSPCKSEAVLNGAKYTLTYPTVDPSFQVEELSSSKLYWIILLILTFISSILLCKPSKTDFAEIKIYFFLPLLLISSYYVFFAQIPTKWGPLSWNTFAVNPDSQGWSESYTFSSSRPPLYPTLINAVFYFNDQRSSDIDWSTIPIGKIIGDQPQNPLLKVVKTQKLLFLSGFLLCAWVLMSFFPPPMVLLAFYWIFANSFIPHEFDSIFAETIAQAWMYVVSSAFIAFVFNKSKKHFILLALATAILLHIRSSGVFILLLYFVAGFYFIYFHKYKSYKTLIISVLVLSLTILSPNILRFIETGLFTPAPMFSDARIAFALQVAKPKDLNLIKDNKSREFFQKALKRRNKVHKRWYKKYNIDSELKLLGANLYRVAHPVAERMGLNETEKRGVFQSVAEPIILKNYKAYFALFAESFDYAFNSITRFGKNIWGGFLSFSMFYLLLCLFFRTKGAFIAFSFWSAHLFHIVIICLFDVPQERYIFASEFLLILGGIAITSDIIQALKLAILRAEPFKELFIPSQIKSTSSIVKS
jgi:hypothetical protein